MDPFVEEMTEVEDYKRLLSKPLAAPRDLDWGILNDLLISEDVRRYLSLLGLTVFENIVQETFPKLTLEFFSTVAMHDNGKYLTALLKGKECKVTDAILNGLFEFGTEEAARHSPMGWKADPYWPLISPCTSFKKAGDSSGLSPMLPWG
ncbi:type III effector HopAC1 [Striga asiatica]|uniref:Type III effector HopAC1 n=1 Tax=Striga asiatica TaxID=4170 RepID=A0A5A7PWW5_STRAF|nr:type III effector HopAC1 [Striga asiatica]